MWLDGMVFLPLIMYGINKIVDEKKPLLYTISLAVMLFANYFIGYMICIFAVLYFIGYFLYKKDFKIKNIITKGLMFGISSLLAGGLVAFALVPLYSSLASISATSGTFPEGKFNFKVLDFIFNHLTGVERTVFASDKLPLPNVYAGILTLLGLLLFFLNKKINKRAKVLALMALLTFLLAFESTTIDYIMHAFHVPNDLPWRYSFIYVFVITTVAYYGILRIKDAGFIKVTIASLIIMLMIFSSVKLSFVNITDAKAITCLILLICYYLIYVLSTFDNIPKKPIYAFLLVLTVGECVYGINSNWNINHDIKTFMSSKKPYKKLIDNKVKEDNDLYRMEKTSYLTLNDAAWYDYKGISTFTSMAYEDTAKFQRMFGLSGNDINSYYYQHSATPVYNTMFNVKYIMGDYIENDYYTALDSNDTYNITSYNYSSSLVYAVDKSIKDWALVSYMPFYNQNTFAQLATGYEDVFKEVKVSSVAGGEILGEEFKINSNGEFTYSLDEGVDSLTLFINNPKRQNLYFYVGGNEVSSFSINDKFYSITSDEYYIVDAGTLPEGDVSININFKNNYGGNLKFYAYYLDDSVFKNFYKEISSGLLNVTKYSDTLIEGDITAKKGEIAFSTISYDNGWKVFVDDKEVKTYKLANAYLGFPLKEGKHKVKLVYYPDKMKLGIFISTISLIIVSLYAFYSKNKSKYVKKTQKGKFNV